MTIIKESTGRTNVSDQPDAFIRNHQYNFIKEQALNLVTAHATANDAEVLSVLRDLSHEKVFALFPALTEEQKKVLRPLTAIKDSDAAEGFLAGLRPHLIPFPSVTTDNLKRLFPKAKRLKGPNLQALDFHELSYLAWQENTNRFLVAERNGRLQVVSGQFGASRKQGICMICHKHGSVGLFTAKTSASADSYVKHGQYICADESVCNSRLTTLERLERFLDRLER
ncbi:FusB/FusC family EF-G-binding protein [Planococcus sp. ISL-109]|uniref:FusB/FusC family EF-G-binding protein n=1 Tax=Planococcus sp. ISL-109 TaxID=2819166 RepID=UPI001BEBF2DD|nr:FusB/FusC family EF-G-binding protein [Planococcus sp. ISL-109]MBT2583251.1 FusB/FusC family EF-G-binding protein [Planococcus sp. ISL-109]